MWLGEVGGAGPAARRLDLGKSGVHRLLATLVAEGLVEQDPRTGGYRLGIVVFELSWGLLGDVLGRKKLLYAGAALSVVGSVLAALAPTTEMMTIPIQ